MEMAQRETAPSPLPSDDKSPLPSDKSPSPLPSDDKSPSDDKKPWNSYHTVYTNAKAGMEGVDKEKVQRVVYEMSKGSKYFENEERKEALMKQKVENMRVRCAKLTTEDLSHFQKVADERVLELEAGRDLSRIWLHVDMDAFYAACETLCDPSLEGKPMAVGGNSMISTANYEARKFGVRAAMPGFIARKLCPKLIFVPVDFKKYTHYSDLTRKVFQKYDSNFLAASLDEAYLDITNVCLERGLTGGEVAEELRTSVFNETGLTCSAGVAPNRLLAKVCSDINKPNGQFVLPNDRAAVTTFISSLPIRKIGGIGKVTDQILQNVFAISTCEEMLQKRGFLCALFSRSSSDFFLSVALGIGGTETPESRSRKSISNERTFRATGDEALLKKKIEDLSEMLATDMEKEGLSGKTLTLKLKTASFKARSRAVTFPNFISSHEDILKHALKLLKAELPASLRLIGLRMSQLNDDKSGGPSDPTQKTLADFNVCKGNTNDNVSVDSDISDTVFTTSSFMEHPADNSDRCSDLENSECNNQVSDSAQDGSILHHNHEKAGSSVRCGNNESIEKIDHLSMERGLLRPCRSGDSSLPERDISNLPALEKIENQKESFYWVDDYKCSLCGAELPPSFVEERQEHSDFHLAERLQEEESGDLQTSPHPTQRFTPRERTIAPINPKKKPKLSSPSGKHVPINAYFAKPSRNF